MVQATETTRGLKRPKYKKKQLDGYMMGWPYTPVRVDKRYGEEPGKGRVKANNIIGWDTRGFEYSQTYFEAIHGQVAFASRNSRSLFFVGEFQHPASTYAKCYRKQQRRMFVPDSNGGDGADHAYAVIRRPQWPASRIK